MMKHACRKTKILATLGPASDSPKVLEQLIQSGADGFRLNFSHGTHEYFRPLIGRIREVSARLKKPVSILQDLQGPKIRIGMLKDDRPVELREGANLVITTREVEGDANVVSTSYRALPADVRPGDRILIDDGSIELKVLESDAASVRTRVAVGGTLRSKKGINLPGVSVSAASVTEKDMEDAQFGLEMNVDYIALSFVRTADDIRSLRRLLVDSRRADIRLIAKIEKPEGVKNVKEILQVADGVMVARGDLGVEMPAERVPLIQKMIIEQANKADKLVITATQMLESMVHNVRPTRAEASDVANAILDGTDVVMLSQETAAGEHPVRAVKTMASIALYTESDEAAFKVAEHIRPQATSNFTHAIVHAARDSAVELKAQAIVVFTQSGFTAQLASCQRPPCPIYALTPMQKTHKQLALVWGVTPVLMDKTGSTESMLRKGEEKLVSDGMLRRGDLVVIVSGTHPIRGATNMLKIERIG